MLCGQRWRGWGQGGFPRKRLSSLNWTCCWWEEQGWRPGGNSVCVKFEALEWFWMIGTGVPDWRGEVSCLFFFGNFYKSPLNLEDYTPPHLYLQLNFSYGLCVCVCVCVCVCMRTCVRAQSCPTLCDFMDCSPPGSSAHGTSQNTGVGCHFLLQGVLLTQAGIQSASLASPALTGRFFTASATWEDFHPYNCP